MFICCSAFNKQEKMLYFILQILPFHMKNISIGDNVGIGKRASFNASVSYIVIGSNIAPNVKIK